MNNPNDPFAVPPEGAPIPGRPAPAPAAGHPAPSPQPPMSPPPYAGPPPLPPYGGPPHQPPYAGPPSQPPHGAPPKNNSTLLIGIIAALALVIAVGATLFFTGVIGGQGGGTGERLAISRDAVVGSWSTDGDCSAHISEFTAAGTLWEHNLQPSGGGDPPRRAGSWRLNGNRLTTSNEVPGMAPLEVDYIINWVSSDAINASHQGEEKTWPRCQITLASGAAPTPPGTAALGAAPTQPAPAGNVAAQLQQAVAQVQPRLPMQSGPATITSVTAAGTTMRMRATIARVMTPADWARLDASIRPGLCRGSLATVVRAGATVDVMMQDQANAVHVLTISSC